MSVLAALRFAGPAFLEWLHAIAAWNVALVLGVVILLLPTAGTPWAFGVVPLAVWLANPLLRVSVLARRDRVVRLADGLPALTRRAGAKGVVAIAVAAVMVLAAVNLALLPALGDVLAGMVGVATVVAIAGAAIVGLSTMTLLNDPEHEARPAGELLRLAVAAATRHPTTWLALLVAGALAARIAAELVWPILLLPGFVALILAGMVVPAADRLVQPSGSERTKTRGRPARSSRTG